MAKSILLIAVVALSLVVLASAACPQLQTKTDFVASNYLGIWYEINRYAKSPFEPNTYCDYANYTVGSQSGHIGIDNVARRGSPTAPDSDYIGDAYAPDPSQPAKLVVNFNIQPVPAPLWILDTDYETYSILFSCDDVLGVAFQWAWIQSRSPYFANSTEYQSVLAQAEQLGVDTSLFIQTPQSDCGW